MISLTSTDPVGSTGKQWQRHVMDDKCLAIEAAVHARVFQVDP